MIHPNAFYWAPVGSWLPDIATECPVCLGIYYDGRVSGKMTSACLHVALTALIIVVFIRLVDVTVRVPVPPGKSWNFKIRFPELAKNWKMIFVLESTGNSS